MNLEEALHAPESYLRLDESDDAEFYGQTRCVYHLDARARKTVQRVIGTLCVEEAPAVLDLMSSIDSHLPEELQPRELVGLGLNPEELRANERLDRRVLHDLNKEPRLPFEDASFDVVLNTVSVDYLTKPFEVFADVQRVLKPGGVFIVVFSNRLFPQKATQLWRDSDDLTRIWLVERFFTDTEGFGPPSFFSSRGQPRPEDDKYAGLGLPSDPLMILHAEKSGAPEGRRKRPKVEPEPDPCPPPEVVEARKRVVKETLTCPYCESALEKFEIEPNPFCEWPDEYVWVCFNNDCPYLITGWDTMADQGNVGYTYRLMYNPTLNRCLATPCPNGRTAREGRVSPRG